MPKRENYDKNGASAEAHRKKNSALNQTPERRARQVRYLLDSIEESVKAGRQEYTDEVDADVKRLLARAEALEAQNG